MSPATEPGSGMSGVMTMAYDPARSGTRWFAVQAQVYAEETHCWWCHKWVDQTLPRTHPMGRTVDHLRELWQGGDRFDRANLRLAHRRCNTAKSNKARAKRQPAFTVDASAL